MKKLMLAAAMLATVAAAPAIAAEAAAATQTVMTTAETDIGTLLDNPASKAVLEKYLAPLVTNPQIDMARSMTLKQIQGFAADQVTDEVLAKIDADLAKIGQSK